MFDFVSQKDATRTACKDAMDPLLTTKRKRKTSCENPWDRKWSKNRYEHIRLRCHAAIKHVKEKPDTELLVERAHPSVKSREKEEMIESEDGDFSSREVDFTLSFEKEMRNKHQKQLEDP